MDKTLRAFDCSSVFGERALQTLASANGWPVFLGRSTLCAGPPTRSEETMTKEELEAFDERGLATWSNNDPDAWVDLFADDFVLRDATLPEPIRTKDEVRAYMQAWLTGFPDMKLRATNRVIGEDAVAAEVEFTGTNTGPLQMGGTTIPPTGKSVVGTGSYFIRVQGDKVVEFSAHPDASGMMAQLGLMPQGSPDPDRHSGDGKRGMTRTPPIHSVSRAALTLMAVLASVPTSSKSSTTTSPPSVWFQPPTMWPSHHTVGPPLPAVSNSCARCGPRYQSRAFQPMVVGSSAGSSTA
jgi:steroid delta-isomerase-like uncharacterized protein